jgi:hypothetical protein
MEIVASPAENDVDAIQKLNHVHHTHSTKCIRGGYSMLVLQCALVCFVQGHYILTNPQTVNAEVLAWDQEVCFGDL